MRDTDLIGRWGGDEFVVLLAGITEERAVPAPAATSCFGAADRAMYAAKAAHDDGAPTGPVTGKVPLVASAVPWPGARVPANDP